MTETPLVLGPLRADGFKVFRTGVTWLRQEGHLCQPNEVIGFCNLGFRNTGAGPPVFLDERELQVAFAPRQAGKLRIAAGAAQGGYLGVTGAIPWDGQTVLGHLEQTADDATENLPLRLLFIAGRRMSGLGDVYGGLLPGWHRRVRAWWGESGGPLATLLCLGICDAIGPLRGDHAAFSELFATAPCPAHVMIVPNHPVTPCARSLLEQFTRTPETRQAIAQDIREALLNGTPAPTPDDFLFAGALQAAFQPSPIRARRDIITRAGMRTTRPASNILLSLSAEPAFLMVHKKLRYHLHIPSFHQSAAGPAMQTWLAHAFEPLAHTTADIKQDYETLLETITAETKARFLIVNRMSTAAQENIITYAPFDPPMSNTLIHIAAKEQNLMLQDLATRHPIAIIDVDALAAEHGASAHLPDGIHQSGILQAQLREEVWYHVRQARPARCGLA